MLATDVGVARGNEIVDCDDVAAATDVHATSSVVRQRRLAIRRKQAAFMFSALRVGRGSTGRHGDGQAEVR